MAHSKPEILLIHGGWHVPQSYVKFTSALEAAAHTVHVPALPSMNGTRPPDASLDTDTDAIRKYTEKLVDEGRYIVAIMHSYGGQVGTNALAGLGADSRIKEGKKGGVVHLIYMAASVLREGESQNTKVEEFGHSHLMPIAFDFADDMSCLSRDPKALVVGPGVSDEELDLYVSTFVRWNGQCIYDSISHSAWREIPLTYIYATNDMTIPLDYQKNMVENVRKDGIEVETVEINTGHCPNLTATKEVVDVVNDVSSKVTKS